MMRPRAGGAGRSRRDPPLEPPEGAQPCSCLDFRLWAPELQEDELLLSGARFAAQHYSHPRPGGRRVCQASTTPGGSLFWGRDDPCMQGEGWAWRGGPHRPSGFFCHPASPQPSSRTRRPEWAPLPRVTGIWEDIRFSDRDCLGSPPHPRPWAPVPIPPSPSVPRWPRMLAWKAVMPTLVAEGDDLFWAKSM